MNSALSGKTIVIIGGTTGMGFSAAKACVAAGARVAVVGRNGSNVEEARLALGPDSIALSGDATDSQTAVRAIDAAVEKFGALHGLYHVAGGSGRRMGDGPLHEITDEGWNATLNINLTALFNSNRAAVRQFLKQGGGGSVLNMGSILGSSPSVTYFSTHAYAASKSAVIGFSKSCAAYYAPKNIRFNVIAPAVVDTPMAQRAASDETILKFLKTKQPLDGGRVGIVEDMDAAVVFFLSDQSRFVTGQVLAIDGGWSLSEGQIPENK